MKGDIILGHADLTRHFDDLNFDVHRPQVLAERVHLDQPRVDRPFKAARSSQQYSPRMPSGDGCREPSKLRDQADLALVDRLEWVGAAEAARKGATETEALPKAVN